MIFVVMLSVIFAAGLVYYVVHSVKLALIAVIFVLILDWLVLPKLMGKGKTSKRLDDSGDDGDS